MKFKKVLFMALSATLLFTLAGCQSKKKAASPVLTKSAVIQKAQKPYKSGQVIQSIRLSTDTSSQTVIANTLFGSNPTVFHINNQTTSHGKSSTSEEWINMNHVYLHGQKAWYRAELDKLSGHSYAELMDAATNNKLLNNPSDSLVKAYKMKRNKGTYTLTANLKDKKLMKAAIEPIISTVGQSAEQEKVFRRIAKYGKYQNMTVKLIVKNKKLFAFNVFVNMKLGKYMKARIGQSYGNFGSRDFLKVPNEALNSKPLPTQNNKK